MKLLFELMNKPVIVQCGICGLVYAFIRVKAKHTAHKCKNKSIFRTVLKDYKSKVWQASLIILHTGPWSISVIQIYSDQISDAAC